MTFGRGGPVEAGSAVVLLGAGRMGLPVTRRLAAAGYRVHVVEPDAGRRHAAAAGGATSVSGGVPDDIAVADVLVTVLPGAAEVRAEMVTAGTAGRLPTGSTWLDLTSGDPRVTSQVASALTARSVGTVAAAMAGGVPAAVDGSLDLLVGGAAAEVARVRPILEVLSAAGGSVRHVGAAVGAGQVAKLLGNLLWFGQAVAVTEALLVGRAAGLDPADLLPVLRAGPGGSAFLDRHADALLRGDDLTDFGLDRCVEELEVLESLANGSGTPFDLSRQVVAAYRDALAHYGAVDGELLAARWVQERTGHVLYGS